MKTELCKRVITGFVLVVFLLGSMLATPIPAQAAGSTITVNTWVDENNTNSLCSLREAVLSANKNIKVGACTAGSAGTDVIVLPANLKDSSNTTQFFRVAGAANEDQAATGDLDIRGAVTIRGAGATKTTIAGNGDDRIFHLINLGSALVTIQDVKIIQGSDKGSGGGGILNLGSTLLLRNVILSGNNSTFYGGGGVRNHINILVEPPLAATLTIINSSIDANFSAGDGGAVSNDGNLAISNSLVSNNTANNNGGGISSTASNTYHTQIVNTTVTGNIGINGAGVYSAAVMEITNATIHDNRGTSEIGTIKGLVVQANTSITINNTIISGHMDPRDDCEIQSGVTLTTNNHNISQDTSCQFAVDPSRVGVNPLLGSFDYHSGATQLFTLQSGSPAIDGGANEDCPSTDQRGILFGRPGDGADDIYGIREPTCDIGAFETDPVSPTPMYLPLLFR